MEGESDERILRAWAGACGAQEAMEKGCFKTMGSGGKKNMKERADAHFVALQQAVALSMTADEIHEDVHEFIAKMRAMTGQAQKRPGQ